MGSAGQRDFTERDTAMTTVDTITPRQIDALRTEAVHAGDEKQVDLCQMAEGAFGHNATVADREALRECVRVINNAEAQ